MNAKTLNEILRKHETWLASEETEGERADLREADLRGADLRRADLREADLRRADLREADLRGANLQWANLLGANLDFSAWPLWCGSFNVKVDDRLIAQLICHITRLDISGCSENVQEAIKTIQQMPIANLFCEFRGDVEKI